MPPSGPRTVRLADNRVSPRRVVEAEVVEGVFAGHLSAIEEAWSEARLALARAIEAGGLPPLEHDHWDWRNKAESVQAGRHVVVALRVGDDAEAVQGLMAVLRQPRPARLSREPLLYVDYVESAPWNLRAFTGNPRFGGVGTALIAEAVRMSAATGCEGRIGLHSLPQAEPFYAGHCGMTALGYDEAYFDLAYFEFTRQQAADWMACRGETF